MRVVFMGTPAPGAAALKRILEAGHEIAAVYTQPDRPAGRGNKLHVSAVKELAIGADLQVLQPDKVRTDDAIVTFRAHRADVAVVVAYGRILPEPFLTAFEYGAINVHFSLLPKYRGAAPVNWAIVNGETTTGVTTMKMDVGLDTGPVLLQRSTEIAPEETAPELMGRLTAIGADLLIETLDQISSLDPKTQDHSAASFAPIMKREDGLIDWSLPAKQIVDRVRGFQPFPGSFTVSGGKKLIIWRASAEFRTSSNSAAGEILDLGVDGLLVGAGDGSALRILEVQPEGKKRMPVGDFLNGTRLTVGQGLGNYE
jgi:methionyl-tRNA formyltransferase